MTKAEWEGKGGTIPLHWDGVSDASAPRAETADVFTGGSAPFHLVLPAAVAGEPVPPPFCDLVLRVLDGGEAAFEHRARLLVPQVVRLLWTENVVALFTQNIQLKETEWSSQYIQTIYEGCTQAQSVSALELLPALIQSRFPADCNIRVVPPNQSVLGLHKTLHLIALPLSSSRMMNAISIVAVHEIGHLLGLVSDRYLGGSQGWHNKSSSGLLYMDQGETRDVLLHFESPIPMSWSLRSRKYLFFILPGATQ